MSCETSERDLHYRRAYAIKCGWDWTPDQLYCDAECPYCGVELVFEYDYDGASFVEEDCPACGRTFDVSIDWEPMYLLTKKEGQ